MGKVSAVTLHYILKVLNKHYNLDTKELLDHIEVDPSIFSKENSYLDNSKIKLLFHKAVELCDDPCLPLHLGKFSSPESIGILGYMLANTATILQMLEKLCHFSTIIGKNLNFILKKEKDTYQVSILMYQNPFLLLQRYQTEIHLSAIISLLRQLSGTNLIPVKTTFQHEKVDIINEYTELFGENLVFESHQNALFFTEEQLQKKLESPYPGLLKYFESEAEKIIESLYQDNWHTRVRKSILLDLGNKCIDIACIADKFNISTRMLQNHLKNEGYTYAKLLEDVRKKLSKHYIENFSMDLATIAIYIGYNDISAFSRSFKKWFGISPQEYRKQLPFNLGHSSVLISQNK